MKTRLHPSIILENLFSSLIFIVFIGYYIIMQMLGDLSENDIENTAQTLLSLGLGIYGLIILTIIILLIIFTIYFWIKWKNTYFSFNDDSVIIEKGKLFKKITTIHLKDIATINIKRNILEKILGTSNIKIDLNTTGETYNGKLIFKENKAIEIKNEILSKTGKEIINETEEIESTVKYDNFDVLKHLFLSINIVSIIILVIIYLIILILIMEDSKPIGIVFGILPLLIIVFPLVWSFIKTFLGYYNFKCSRENNNIKLSYGALTTYKYSLPIKKINAVIIHQTLQARILGYYLIEVVNAGIGENEEEKTIISLYVKENEKNIIMNEILPEYKNEIEIKKDNKDTLKHYITAKIFWIIISIILMPFTNYISLILIPLVLLIALLQYNTNKIGNNNNIIIISKGIINKKTTIIKYSNIELIQSKQKLFSHFFKTKTLQINVVGPMANNSFISGLFKQQTIENIINIY